MVFRLFHCGLLLPPPHDLFRKLPSSHLFPLSTYILSLHSPSIRDVSPHTDPPRRHPPSPHTLLHPPRSRPCPLPTSPRSLRSRGRHRHPLRSWRCCTCTCACRVMGRGRKGGYEGRGGREGEEGFGEGLGAEAAVECWCWRTPCRGWSFMHCCTAKNSLKRYNRHTPIWLHHKQRTPSLSHSPHSKQSSHPFPLYHLPTLLLMLLNGLSSPNLSFPNSPPPLSPSSGPTHSGRLRMRGVSQMKHCTSPKISWRLQMPSRAMSREGTGTNP